MKEIPFKANYIKGIERLGRAEPFWITNKASSSMKGTSIAKVP